MKELIKFLVVGTFVLSSAIASMHGYQLAMSMLDGMVNAAYGNSALQVENGVLSAEDQQSLSEIHTDYSRRTSR